MSASPPAASIDKQPQWGFWIALAAVPVAFFLVLELLLRLGGYGADLRLFHRVEWGGREYFAINPGVVQRYFSDPDFGTYTSRDRFLAKKPADVYRIFCLGASTTAGTPYLFNGDYSTLIRDRLEMRFPEKRFEVVNLGITAVNSFTVAELASEVVDYEPDLLIVYMGHNEFYGALGIGSTESAGRSPQLVRLYLKLQHLKIVQLLRDAMRAVLHSGGTRAPDDRQLMEKMVADQQIRIGNEKYRAAEAYFRANYEDVIRTARSHGVDVLISTLASNLADQPPFVSLHSEDLSDGMRARWQAHFDRARAAAEAGDCATAIDEFRRAITVDDARADAYFGLGRCLQSAGKKLAALDAFTRARDLDALRFRADTDFNEIVRDLSRTHDVGFVDMEKAFADSAGGGAPGAELFWEHVHPTFDGYLLMAKAFTQAMAEYGFAASKEEWAKSADRPDAFYRSWAGLTEFDHVVARLRIDIMKTRWPFRPEAVPFSFSPVGTEQEAAWDYFRRLRSWAASHEDLAQTYRSRGELAAAADHFFALGKNSPVDPRNFEVAADLLARARQFERAAEVYRYVLRIRQTPETYAKLGMLVYQLRDFPQAIEHLEQAAASPSSTLPSGMRVDIYTLLATAYLNEENVAGAEKSLEKLQAAAPRAPQIPALQAAIERFKSRRP